MQSQQIIDEKYQCLLDKIRKIHDSLDLPFDTIFFGDRYREMARGWLTVGAGAKFSDYVNYFNKTLYELLEKNGAVESYPIALGKMEMSLFFEKYPDIRAFFSKELEKDNSPLEQMHDAFWKGVMDPVEFPSGGHHSTLTYDPTKLKISAPADYKQNTCYPNKLIYRLRCSDSIDNPEYTDIEITPEEYEESTHALNMYGFCEKGPQKPVNIFEVLQFIEDKEKTKTRKTRRRKTFVSATRYVESK